MIANIILTIAGIDTGPFNLYSNTDNYGVPFAIGISRSILETGYTSTMVPDGTTIVKVLSTGVCTTDTYANVVLLPITTSTTSTSTSTTSTSTSTSSTTTTTTTAVPTTSTTTTVIVGITCGTPISYGGGTSYPSIETITLGSNLGNVVFNFNPYGVPDKFEVWFDGIKVIDTGYWGDLDQQTNLTNALIALGEPDESITGVGASSMSWVKNSATAIAEVRVYAPIVGTGWDFIMECPV